MVTRCKMATCLVELFENVTAEDSCHFDGSGCSYCYQACQYRDTSDPATVGGLCLTSPGTDYTDASAAFVLICAFLIFFMKAGFMLVEISRSQNDEEKRQIVIVKNMDAFASAFGYFLVGFDVISGYVGEDCRKLPSSFGVQKPLLWFFQYNFAASAATLIGGCLVNFEYRLRVSAAFISAFVISGLLHPLVGRFIWGYGKSSFLSPFRFCDKPWVDNFMACHAGCVTTNCSSCGLFDRLYAIDIAGGGTVHLLGGVVGLVLCLFAKFAARKKTKTKKKQGFFLWLYPVGGGNEDNIEKAALGVLILWVGWFAFNCGSLQNIDGGHSGYSHSVPARIAVNMIMCCASGGSLAVVIACWAQVKYHAATVNANEVANGVLSCLVAITSSCAILEYYEACIVGVLAVILYHFGCWCEYKLNIPDTAHVVPIHAGCGVLSMMVVPFGAAYNDTKCLLHAAYETSVSCHLKLPDLSFWELLLAQILAVVLIIAVGATIFFVYAFLYVIPVRRLFAFLAKVFLLNYKNDRPPLPPFTGNALFSIPILEEPVVNGVPPLPQSPAIHPRRRSSARNPLSTGGMGRTTDDIVSTQTDRDGGADSHKDAEWQRGSSSTDYTASGPRLVAAEMHDSLTSVD